MSTKVKRIVIAVILASSMILAGTAHAGYSEPGGRSAATAR